MINSGPRPLAAGDGSGVSDRRGLIETVGLVVPAHDGEPLLPSCLVHCGVLPVRFACQAHAGGDPHAEGLWRISLQAADG